MPAKYTCEGEGISPALTWRGLPDGTQSLVMIMDHQPDAKPIRNKESDPQFNAAVQDTSRSLHPLRTAPFEGLHWYWSMYNIPMHVSTVAGGETVGTLGSNSVNHKEEYAPPCSRGPDLKTYTFHLYALAQPLVFKPSEEVSAALLREKMHGLVLDSDSMAVGFERHCQTPAKPHLKQKKLPQQERKPASLLPLCEKPMNTLTSVND
ncbi:YbhB/YbcL family Raf kinase inhibitor-like protein [Psychromonas marina]|nr:YbhB/YbcL family Raf kinase inhibitor-like protein [Psychromonas marina]